MKLSDHIYQVTGNSFGTNSSTYVADAGEELILFDAGYSQLQLDIMKRTLEQWGLGGKPVTHTFLTHVHMDHAANAKLLQDQGSRILIGREDAHALFHGGPETLESLFHRPFTPCRPDAVLADNDQFCFQHIKIHCIALPGHTPGSMGYIIEDNGKKCFITGDFIAIGPVTPDETDQEIMLAAMILPGFLELEYGESLRRAMEIEADMLLPGHLLPYWGNPKNIFEKAYEKYRTEKRNIINT